MIVSVEGLRSLPDKSWLLTGRGHVVAVRDLLDDANDPALRAWSLPAFVLHYDGLPVGGDK